jgi:hypothetical protein
MSSRFTELTQFANEMDVVLKFFDLGMKIQDFEKLALVCFCFDLFFAESTRVV